MDSNYFGIYVQALLAKTAANSLQTELNALKKLQVTVTPELGQINTASITKVTKDLQNTLVKQTKNATNVDITPTIDDVAMNKATSTINRVSSSLNNNLIPSVQETSAAIKNMSGFTSSLNNTANTLLGIVGKVAVWGIATNAIYGTKAALQDLFDTYVKLEDELIAIERVSNNFDMSAIFEGAYASAQTYGASLDDMLNSVEEIARSYSDLTEQEALAAAEAGVLASTVADMDGEDAVEGIIAVSNAYGLAIENGQLLIDMANEVDNNYSVTSADIIDAWEKSSATAATFGVEIQSLTGYIAAISTVTQETGSVIGNSLTTIFSRITTMNAASSAIESAGVTVFDSITGEARNVEDILSDLAETWDTLTSTQQQNIGVSVAGRRQLTRFLALMNNWEIASEATTTALNSEGSAVEENATYLESYTAKLTQLDNAMAALSETIEGGSLASTGKIWIDLKIAVVDLANGFFQLADATTVFIATTIALIKALSRTENGYKLVRTALGFLMSAEKADIAAKKIQQKNIIARLLLRNQEAKIIELTTKATKLNTAATAAAQAGQTAIAASLKAEAVAATEAAAATTAFATALSFIIGGVAIAALGFIVGGIMKAVNASREAAAALEEERENIIANKEEIDDYIDKIEELTELKKELSSDAYDATYGDDEEEYLESLAEIYTEISDELLSQNHSLEYKLELIKEINEAQAESTKQSYLSALEDAGKTSAALSETYASGLVQQDSKESWTGYNKVEQSLDKLAESYEEAYSAGQEYYRLVGEISDTESEYINILKETGMEFADSKQDYEDLATVLDNVQQAYAYSNDYGIELVREGLISLGISQEKVNSVLGDSEDSVSSLVDYYDAYTAALEDADEGLADFNDEQTNAINLFFGVGEGTSEAIDSMLSYVKLFGTESEYTTTAADSLAQSLTWLGTQAFESGEDLLANIDLLQLMSDTLSIAAEDEEYYAKAVSDGILYVSEGRKEAFEAYRTNKIAELKVQAEALQAEISGLEATGSATIANAKTIQASCDANIKNYSSWKSASSNAASSIISDLGEINDAIEGVNYSYYNPTATANKSYSTYTVDTTSTEELAAKKAELASLLAEIQKWSDLTFVETTISSFSELANTYQDYVNGTVESIDYYELIENALKSYTYTIDDLNYELSLLEKQNKQLTEGSNEWFENLADQEDVINKNKEAIQSYIVQLKAQLNNSNLTEEEIRKLQETIQDLTLDYEDLNNTLINLNETQEDYYETQKDSYRDLIQDKIELIEELEDERHENALDNIETEREAFQAQIDEQIDLLQKLSETKSYEDDLAELQEERLNVLNQIARLEGDDSRLASSKVVDLYEQLADLEEEISDLNYDRETSLREDALNDLSETLDNYYDELENAEDEKNELILETLENASTTIENLDTTIESLASTLTEWSDLSSNFSNWASTFDSLVTTIPSSNIVSSLNSTNASTTNDSGVTQLTFYVTGSSEDAQTISDTIVTDLEKAGLIVSGN